MEKNIEKTLKNSRIKFPRKKIMKTYLMLREMDIPYKKAKELTICCHQNFNWFDVEAGLTKTAIKRTYDLGLKGREALNKIEKYVEKGLETINQPYSISLIQPYP